jgi:hypothetical protein
MDSHFIYLVAVWRIAWYGYLLYHSVTKKAWLDATTAIFLVFLAFIVNTKTPAHLVWVAALVAPTLTISMVKYQKRAR